MTAPQSQDEWLMADVARGQRAPLETLVRRYASPLLTFLRRMVGDRHRSEELFQEVFLAVWRKRQQYEFPRSFRNWLYAIALNRCRADFRARRPLASLNLDDDAASAPTAQGRGPLDMAIATETARLVADAVAQLPPRQRLVVVLKVWQGLSYTEIADLAELGEATVRSHMHHALRSLRPLLEPHVQ